MRPLTMPGACLALLSALLSAPAAAQQPMLVVDGYKGQVSISRDNQTLVASDGTSLSAGDLVFTAAAGGLEMQLSRYGRIELGGGSQLMIEKLPFSTYASDRHTVLELRGGYLHLLWKHPGASENWLLQMDFGSERLSFNSGEFFFEKGGDSRKFCVASGSAVLTAGSVLEGPACYLIEEAGAPRKVARSSTDFIAMRDARAIQMPAPAAPLKVTTPPLVAAVPVPPAPPPPVVAKPVAPPKPVPAPAATGEPKAVPPSKPESKVEPAAPPVAAAAAPAAAETPMKKPAAGSWTLNITSESDAASAKQAIQKLRAAGYQPTVETAQVKGREWYRVQIAGVEGAEQAKALAAEIEAKLGYNEIWVARKK